MFPTSLALVMLVAYGVHKAGQRYTEAICTAWVLIVMLGFICVIAFYLFRVRTSSNREP